MKKQKSEHTYLKKRGYFKTSYSIVKERRIKKLSFNVKRKEKLFLH